MHRLILIVTLSVLPILTADKAGAIVCHCEHLGPFLLSDCSEPLECTIEGTGCYSEIYRFNDRVSRRWGCIPTNVPHFCETFLHPDIHNVTCCNDTNFCNQELYPSLSGDPPVTTTSTPPLTDPIIVETLTTAEPTVAQPSEPTTNTEISSTTQATLPSSNSTPPSSRNTPPTTQPATNSPLPAVPTSSRSCYRSTSESPDIRVCPLQTTCYVTVRRGADYRVTFKRGCSPRNTLCVPENRNRKIKICCSSSLCNSVIPKFGEAPDLVAGPNNNTTHSDKDNDPVIINGPDIGLDPTSDTNAPDINSLPSSDTTTDRSTPAVTTETTRETVPPETPPPTNNLPESNCVCDSCADGYCLSTMGCATMHHQVDGVLKVTRICIESPAICTYSNSMDLRVDCCKGELCNHVNNTITPPPKPRPTSPTSTTDGLDQTGPTSAFPTSDEREGSPDSSTEGLSTYYLLTILVGVIFLVIAVVLLIICVCVCRRHKVNLAEIRKQRQRTGTPATAMPSIRTGTLA